jgi:hypothetical protein
MGDIVPARPKSGRLKKKGRGVDESSLDRIGNAADDRQRSGRNVILKAEETQQ